VPNQLSAMRGVLSVLGMDQASAALLRMRDEDDGCRPRIGPQRVRAGGCSDRPGQQPSASSAFLIDMLACQA
jgi:chemosensory pili system protein ChpA (sensor histidine kinase/response regulator)